MKSKQTISAFVAFLLAALMLVSVVNVASAEVGSLDTTAHFTLQSVEVNDVKYAPESTGVKADVIEAQRGDTLDINVQYKGDGVGTNDATVTAEVVGYEYGVLRDVVGPFTIYKTTQGQKSLSIKIPEDMRASDSYKLRVTLEDSKSPGLTQVYGLQVEERRHAVNTFDVIVNPPGHVQPGQPLFVTVRVENLGAHVEQSVKVTASMPALGLQTSEYVDVLATEFDRTSVSDSTNAERVRNTATSNDLMLMIPADAKPGQYALGVVVQYNRFHSVQEKVIPVTIEPVSHPGPAVQARSLVGVDSATQRTEVGRGGVVYKVSVANLEGVQKTYSVVVSGVSGWGTYRVDPSVRTVAQDQTGEFNVFVLPADDAQPGTHTFTVTVQDSVGKVMGQQSVSLEVTGNSASPAASTSDVNVKQALEVGFVVLLVILVILGIVIIAKKLASDDSEEEHTGGRVAKKSYY